jgi:addiction module HigA family antidote
MLLPKNRPPTHPGRLIVSGWLEETGMTPAELATAMGRPLAEIEDLLAGKISCNAEHALLLGDALKSDPTFWISAQGMYDLWFARQKLDGRAI